MKIPHRLARAILLPPDPAAQKESKFFGGLLAVGSALFHHSWQWWHSHLFQRTYLHKCKNFRTSQWNILAFMWKVHKYEFNCVKSYDVTSKHTRSLISSAPMRNERIDEWERSKFSFGFNNLGKKCQSTHRSMKYVTSLVWCITKVITRHFHKLWQQN